MVYKSFESVIPALNVVEKTVQVHIYMCVSLAHFTASLHEQGKSDFPNKIVSPQMHLKLFCVLDRVASG